jgi:WXG100 family type VII secretion target
MVDVASAHVKVPAELQAAGPTLNSAAQTITGELARLQSLLQPLQETWIAQSATNFEGLMAEWQSAAVHLFGTAEEQGILGEIAQILNVNWGNYVDTEEANIKMWATNGVNAG